MSFPIVVCYLIKFCLFFVSFIASIQLTSPVIVEATMVDSKAFMGGKVLRIGLIHVNNKLCFKYLKLDFEVSRY